MLWRPDGLLAEFNKMGEQDAKPVKVKEDKTTTLTGGKQLVITEEVYNAIIGKIKAIRNSYTLTK